jgi:amino acid transporter
MGALLASSVERYSNYEDQSMPNDGENGLLFNFLIMVDISIWSPLIYVGIFAATLSSAIASLVGAPRILQAVAQDDLFPLYVVRVFL